MTVIVLAITVLTITSICVAAAIYWWSEATYSRNEVEWYKTHACCEPLTAEEQMTVNLNKLADALTDLEGGKTNLTIAQVKDVIAALGEHWRGVLPEQAAAEFAAIIAKAGLRSK